MVFVPVDLGDPGPFWAPHGTFASDLKPTASVPESPAGGSTSDLRKLDRCMFQAIG